MGYSTPKPSTRTILETSTKPGSEDWSTVHPPQTPSAGCTVQERNTQIPRGSSQECPTRPWIFLMEQPHPFRRAVQVLWISMRTVRSAATKTPASGGMNPSWTVHTVVAMQYPRDVEATPSPHPTVDLNRRVWTLEVVWVKVTKCLETGSPRPPSLNFPSRHD